MAASQPDSRAGNGSHGAGFLPGSASDCRALKDKLGFPPYIRALSQFLLSDQTRGPLTVSIEGEWGSGKSSFMDQLRTQIKASEKEKVVTVWFNAWRHDRAEELWAAFATEFLRQVKADLSWRRRALAWIRLRNRRYDWKKGWLDVARWILISVAIVAAGIWTLRHGFEWLKNEPAFSRTAGKWGLALAGLAGLIEGSKKLLARIGNPLEIDLHQYVKTPNYEKRVSFLEQFHEDFSRIVKTYSENCRVVVFIDDLDRCEVPKAAELMQAINLMVSGEGQENLFFVMGMDRQKVAAGVAVKNAKLMPYLRAGERPVARLAGIQWYGLNFGYEFLEKLIQIPVVVPVPGPKDIERYVESLSPSLRVRRLPHPLLARTWLHQHPRQSTPRLLRRRKPKNAVGCSGCRRMATPRS